jgi:hypothetical protein
MTKSLVIAELTPSPASGGGRLWVSLRRLC